MLDSRAKVTIGSDKNQCMLSLGELVGIDEYIRPPGVSMATVILIVKTVVIGAFIVSENLNLESKVAVLGRNVDGIQRIDFLPIYCSLDKFHVAQSI